MNKNNCGIYIIKNSLNNKIYVGGSKNLEARKLDHFRRLKNNKHKNINLQNAYNLSGRKNLDFIIILYCESFEIKKYEQFFVDQNRNSGLLYNICLDDVNTVLGVKVTENTKQNMSKNHADVSGKNNPMYGKKGKDNPHHGFKHSPETKRKMAESHIGKIHDLETIEKIRIANTGKNNPNIINKNIVVQILKMLERNISIKEICKNLNVSRSTIYKAKNGFYNNIYNLKRG